MVGKNLVLGSDVPYTNDIYNIHNYTLSEFVELNQNYTLTIWGKLDVAKQRWAAYIGTGSGPIIAEVTKIADGVYRATGKKTSWDTDTQAAAANILRIYAIPSSVTGVKSTIERIKFEKGDVGTDYILAPEDGVDLAFTVSSNKISAKEGFDVVTVNFSVNTAYKTFEARATKEGASYGQGIGTLIAAFSNTPALTERTFEIYDEHLTSGDGNYRISLYAEADYGDIIIPVNSTMLITSDDKIFIHA